MEATMKPGHCGVLAMFPGFSYDYRSDIGASVRLHGPSKTPGL